MVKAQFGFDLLALGSNPVGSQICFDIVPEKIIGYFRTLKNIYILIK